MGHDGSSTSFRAGKEDRSERYLAFLLGKEQYAIPLLHVKEVIEMREPMQIPRMPPYFKGIINLRGRVISVLDLRSKLELPAAENGPKTAIVILDFDPTLSVGVVVDRVNSVLSLDPEDISTTRAGTNGQDKYLAGIAKKGEAMTLLLDIKSTLSLEDISAITHAGNTEQAA